MNSFFFFTNIMQRKVSKLATASIKPNRHMQLQVGKKGRPKKAGERNGMGDRGKRRRGEGREANLAR